MAVFLVEAIDVVHLLALADVVVRLRFVPYGVGVDFLSGTLDPIAGSRDEVVRELFAEFVCKNSGGYGQSN